MSDRYFGAVLVLLQQRHLELKAARLLVRRLLREMDELARSDEGRWKRLVLSIVRINQFYREPAEAEVVHREILGAIDDVKRREEVRTMGTSMAEELFRKGEEHGKTLGKTQTLVRLLTRKFGPLPAGVAERIDGLRDEARLDELLERILDAEHLEDMGLPS